MLLQKLADSRWALVRLAQGPLVLEPFPKCLPCLWSLEFRWNQDLRFHNRLTSSTGGLGGIPPFFDYVYVYVFVYDYGRIC